MKPPERVMIGLGGGGSGGVTVSSKHMGTLHTPLIAPLHTRPGHSALQATERRQEMSEHFSTHSSIFISTWSKMIIIISPRLKMLSFSTLKDVYIDPIHTSGDDFYVRKYICKRKTTKSKLKRRT